MQTSSTRPVSLSIISLSLAGLLCATGTNAQASPSPSRDRPLTAAPQLSISGAFTTSLSIGETPKLVIDGPLDAVIVEADDHHIAISRAPGSRGEVKLRVVLKALDELELSGAQDLRASALNGKHLDLKFSGATKAVFAGNYETLDIELSGASKLDASELTARSVKVEMSGASKADLNATETLRVKASGASKVRYRGGANVETDVSGVASIRRI
ncbi:MAG: DUF2807 domain-containing protein [Deltaproteobacteria bacterium]|nr:DUF2807 domain-containing protein [Deltaproteobacteria bacterium]